MFSILFIGFLVFVALFVGNVVRLTLEHVVDKAIDKHAAKKQNTTAPTKS